MNKDKALPIINYFQSAETQRDDDWERMKSLVEAVDRAATTLERITLVQPRSGSIIQQTTKMVAKELRGTLANLGVEVKL